MIKNFIIFLILNFIALGIGGLFTGPGVTSEWYINLNQAPWIPPGWVFGAAWTLIMFCFAFYMSFLIKEKLFTRQVIVLYGVQWILNVVWNPIFFYFQNVSLGLILITGLTLVVFTFLFKYWHLLKTKSFYILPYAIWLCIASSLNAYVLLYN